MKIESLEELNKFIKLCRKNGITDVKVDGMEFHLGEVPAKATRTTPSPRTFATPDIPEIHTPDEMTEEQRLFGSSDPSVWKQV